MCERDVSSKRISPEMVNTLPSNRVVIHLPSSSPFSLGQGLPAERRELWLLWAQLNLPGFPVGRPHSPSPGSQLVTTLHIRDMASSETETIQESNPRPFQGVCQQQGTCGEAQPTRPQQDAICEERRQEPTVPNAAVHGLVSTFVGFPLQQPIPKK